MELVKEVATLGLRLLTCKPVRLMFILRAIGTTYWDDEHTIWKGAWHVRHTVNR